jgi:hypothetical protein
MFINNILFLRGLVIWAGATLLLRVAGQRLFHPGAHLGILLLFLISLPAMAWLVRNLCQAAGLPPAQWPAGAISVALPTLLLDPFSSALFPSLFPNIAPQMAGVFGGWIIWCCAGALLGVMVPARRQS